jgi:polyvinyl alcohol dehydrogenase (cytochrome)
LVLLAGLAEAAAESGDTPALPTGAELFAQNCAVCHLHGVAGAPSTTLLNQMPPAAIYNALTRGAMVGQGARLSDDERKRVVAFLAGGAPIASSHPLLRCETPLWQNQPVPAKTTAWGVDPHNSRSVGAGDALLSESEVKSLTLDWSFVFADSIKVRSQPVVVGGVLFVGGQDGTVFALDAVSGCVFWTFQAAAEIRGAVAYGAESGQSAARLYFGDVFANVYSLDARTGALQWKVRVDDQPTARIVGSILLASDHLYVPVGSWGEEIAAASPDFACCTFRGSMVALDRRSGSIVWKRYTIPDVPTLHEVRNGGKALYGPAGASIWSSPTYDATRDILYFATGDNFSSPADDNSDAIFALQGADGRLLWKNQVTAGDAYNDGCLGGQRLANCPEHFGADIDFTAPPILVSEKKKQILLAGQKSGDAYGFEPDTGRIIWHMRISNDPNPWSGGIWFGMVAQSERLIVPVVSFPSVSSPAAVVDTAEKHFLPAAINGLQALDPLSGKSLWHSRIPRGCQKGTCQSIMMAPLGIPGIIFAGTMDGVMRAYDERTGAVVWQFDTATQFVARNGDQAKGGILNGAGVVAVAQRHLYVISSNVLLALSPKKESHD